MTTTYTLSTIPARAATRLIRARPAVRVILADGIYFCDAPDSPSESAELIAGLIADEAERVAAAEAERVAAAEATSKYGTINLADGTKVLLMEDPHCDNNAAGNAAWFAAGYLSTETPDDETGPTVKVEWASLGAETPDDDADWSAPVSVRHYSRGELALA